MFLGTARCDISPSLGTPLAGWPVERPSESLSAPLECRVLYLQDATTSVLLVTLDLLGMADWYARNIREEVERRTGVPATAVLLSCSHTHSGPVLPPCLMEGISDPDPRYMEWLAQQIVEAAVAATAQTVAVSVGAGTGTCALGISRRRPDEDGMVPFPPRANPDGSVDHQVGVVRFDDGDGVTRAALLSYGCHPTVAGTSRVMGPDYPGYARQELERAFPEAMAAFVLGNCGDVRSNYTMDDGRFRWDVPPSLAEEAGTDLGAEAVRVAREVVPQSDSSLAVGYATADLYTQRDTHISTCEFSALRLGNGFLATSPAECFSGIGLQLRRGPQPPLMFASITNGFLGYVPTRDAYPHGGYEVALSYRHFGLDSPVREDSGEIFYECMRRALQDCGYDAA